MDGVGISVDSGVEGDAVHVTTATSLAFYCSCQNLFPYSMQSIASRSSWSRSLDRRFASAFRDSDSPSGRLISPLSLPLLHRDKATRQCILPCIALCSRLSLPICPKPLRTW